VRTQRDIASIGEVELRGRAAEAVRVGGERVVLWRERDDAIDPQRDRVVIAELARDLNASRATLVERLRTRDERDVGRHAAIACWEDVQPTQSAQQNDGRGPWTDPLDSAQDRCRVLTCAACQNALVERAGT
jgi:hypothetical protein